MILSGSPHDVTIWIGRLLRVRVTNERKRKKRFSSPKLPGSIARTLLVGKSANINDVKIMLIFGIIIEHREVPRGAIGKREHMDII